MDYKDFEIRLKKAEDDKGGKLVAYASTFEDTPDHDGDIVVKGAFEESIKAWADSGNTIPLFYGHRCDDPLYNIGAVTKITEDEKGLLIEADFDESNEKAQYCRKLVKEKRLTKMSFAYRILESAWCKNEDDYYLELRKLDIKEVSLVPFPANDNAEVVSAKAEAKKSAIEELKKTIVADESKSLEQAQSTSDEADELLAYIASFEN